MKRDKVDTGQESEELMAGCARGERAAQRRLYELYSSRMFGVCLAYSSDRMEAEDTLHDGFMKVFSNASQYKGDGSPEGWIRRIMVNTALEKYRRSQRLQAITDQMRYESTFGTEHILEQIAAKEIMEAVMDLTPQYRVVFLLYAVEGYSHKEIAEQLDISEGTSKSNLSRGRNILQERLRQLGADDAQGGMVVPLREHKIIKERTIG
jgi:RNA polymerase sigma factor (sigma-70 family)